MSACLERDAALRHKARPARNHLAQTVLHRQPALGVPFPCLSPTAERPPDEGGLFLDNGRLGQWIIIMTIPGAFIYSIGSEPDHTLPKFMMQRLGRRGLRLAVTTGETLDFGFGDFAIDVARHELRRGGELVSIEPQVFDLLVHLVRNRGRIVSKNELIDAVWLGRVVSEATLSSRMSAARHAIGDNGADQ